MRFPLPSLAGTALLVLSAATCSASEDRDAKLARQLSDIEIYNETAVVKFNRDGTLYAEIRPPNSADLVIARGSWRIVDGKFCRKLQKAPKGVERQLCEIVKIRGKTVSFDGLKPDGRRPVVYKIR